MTQAESFDRLLRNRAIDLVLRRGETNKRGRDCWRCRQDTPKGTGTLARYWWNGRRIETYLCAGCTPVIEAMLDGEEAQHA
jgi:hypothetical protein